MSTAHPDKPAQADEIARATEPAHVAEASEAAKPEQTAAAAHSAEPPQADVPFADEAADAMKDQLRKDVASWREGRADGSSRGATELSVAVTRSIVPPTTARMKRAKPVVAEVKPANTEKKPFGMSYDGTSRADYIKLMISRGAR
jgi:hypothetical protein